MSNSIVATIPFDFKGVHHTPSTRIDLDEFISGEKVLTSIYTMVAVQNQVGAYSYEHEVLLSSDIIFSQPEGIAEQFFDDGNFDMEGFRQAYHQQRILHDIGLIAREHLDVDDLEQNPDLKQALLEAYRCGSETLK
ncbi:MAG: hypothetical protein GQ470_00450 [Gammaproteobacteria bacterium]|nr:hypothetical protein [Gammaproteobacteria bacterium]